MAWPTQPGQSIWKAQAITTWPRCAPRSSGVDVFSHFGMRQGDANAG
jgi:hypothetical protein